MNKYYQKLLRQRRKLFNLYISDDTPEEKKDEIWNEYEKVSKEAVAEKERQDKAMNAFIHCIDGDNFDIEKFKRETA